MTTFPHILDPAPRSGRVKKPQDSATHLEAVLMSRLITSHVICTCGAFPAGRPLAVKILRHGFRVGHRVSGLEAAFGRPRQLLLRDLAKCGLAEPSHWLAVCRALYAVWIHFRLRGTFGSAVEHLGIGSRYELSGLCKRVSGVRPGQAHIECLEAKSILPFMDRCIPYLRRV